MLYNFARRYDEYAGENYEGSSCRGALKGWFHHGVCLVTEWSYLAGKVTTPNLDYVERAADSTLGVYYRIDVKSITDLQAAIAQVGAIYVSVNTHRGWQVVPTLKKAITEHADLPLIAYDGNPSTTDGHAFALVGFNSKGFVVQNSWGTEWGGGGFAVLSYADWLANAMDAWVAAMGVPGVMQAAFDAGLTYAQERTVFGKPVFDYQLSKVKLARMAALICAGRQFSYDVARKMARGEGALEASMVKAYVCRAAEWVTREAMQLHGGMGYAEEFPVSRYFVDARVLSIFEGADETLCLRVIARRLTEQALSA
jgi:hypothetical protein